MRNTSGRKVGPEDKTMTLTTSRDKTVVVTVQTRAAVPPQHAFKVNVPIDLTFVFKGWGHSLLCEGRKTRPVHGTTSAPLGTQFFRMALRRKRL